MDDDILEQLLKEYKIQPPPASVVQQLFEKMEKRVDTLEMMFAQILMAYTEMWAALESVSNQFLETRSPEEQKVFIEQFREFRTHLISELEKASKGGLEDIDPNLTDSIQRMAFGDNLASSDPEGDQPADNAKPQDVED